MRQSKTLKICANHLVLPTMTVQEYSGNDKSCVCHAPDFADSELKEELFCIRFATVENCKNSMETFQDLAKTQGEKEDDKEETVTAGLLEKLSVGDSKPKENGQDEASVVANEQEEFASKQTKPDGRKINESDPPEKV